MSRFRYLPDRFVFWFVLAMAALCLAIPTFAQLGSTQLDSAQLDPAKNLPAHPPDDPILHLTFSESSDSKSSPEAETRHLTSLEKDARLAAGMQGQGVELGGDGDFVVTQPTEDLRIAGDLTVSLWLYPHAYPTDWTGLISKMESDATGEFALRLKDASTGELTYGTGASACSLSWDPSTQLPLDTWTQLTAVRDLQSNTLSLFVNGYEEVSRAACGAAATTWNPLWVGKDAETGQTFDGRVDEIKVYDRALSAVEVANGYASQGFVQNSNLITNPGFETGAYNPPFVSAAKGSLSVDSTTSAHGQYSLKHTATDNDSYTSPYIGQAAAVGQATGGQKFQLSVMATAAEALPIQLRIFCMDASYGFHDMGTGNFTTSTSWERFTITHECAPGSEYVSFRVDNDGGTGKIVWWDDLYLVAAVNNATFSSQLLPASLTTGEASTATLTMTNTGTTLWTRDQLYRLGLIQPADITTWGPARALLAAGDVVRPGDSHSFVLNITAPSTPGSYDFQWRMLREGVQWFGASTPNVSIPVTAPDTTAPTQNSLVVSDALWEVDGENTYRIVASADDAESGVQRVDASINLQGSQSAHRRGWFTWDANTYVHGGDQHACKGGGFASKDLNGGDADTITLSGCSTSTLGGQRFFTFTVRPETAFGDLTDNDVSMSAADAAGNSTGWVNYDLNFQSVIAATPGSNQGCGMEPLTSSGGPFFKGPGAAPVYLRGSHTWDNAQDWGNTTFNNDAYLNMMEAKGHNLIRLWSWQREKSQPDQATTTPMPWVKVGQGSQACYDLYDGPLDLTNAAAFDESKVIFNEAYFNRLAQRVGAACGKNIYVDVMLFQGYSVRGANSPWVWHPFNQSNNCEGVDGNLEVNSTTDGRRFHEVNLSNPPSALEDIVGKFQKAYVKKVIDTLSAYPNVFYEVANEDVGTAANIAWEYDIIDLVQQEDANSPMGMTSFGFGNSNTVLVNSGASWISPAVHGGQDYSFDPPLSTGSPVIFSDNDHLRCILETPTFTNDCNTSWLRRANYRQWIWKSFTRGLNVMLMDAVQHTIPGQASNYPAVNPGNPAFPFARDYVGHTGYFADQLNLTFVEPKTTDCSSTGYCLAETGVTYLVYQPENGSFTVNLPAGVYEAKWFNPHGIQSATSQTTPVNAATMDPHIYPAATNVTVSSAGNVQFGNGTAFPRPFGCEGNSVRYECDAVLLLDLLPTDPPPAAPDNVSASDAAFTDKVRITWSAVPAATSYEVWRSAESDFTDPSRIAAGLGATSFNDETVDPGVHYYRLRSRNQAGFSELSAQDEGSIDANPDIAVISLWDNQSRTDGSTVVLPPMVEGYPQTQTLRIQNLGRVPLNISNPATLLANHPCIDQVAAVEPVLEEQETTDLQISMDCNQGTESVSLVIQSNDPDENPFNLNLQLSITGGPTCTADSTHLCLQNDRFRVSATFVNPNTGNTGNAQAVSYAGSDESGMFWFFGPDNLEMVVKVLDGTGINGSFWVFHGGATNVEYTLFVEDMLTGDDWQYTKPFDDFCGGADTDAFPQGQNAGSAPVQLKGEDGLQGFDLGSWIDSELAATPNKSGSCVPSDTVLCLHSNRFALEVDWEKPNGDTGVGHAIPVTDETGLFWFFGAGNLELMVKVLDGQGVNGNWWVFYGSLSNVEYDITVTDTATGNSIILTNPQGTYCGDANTTAFPGD